MIHTSICLYGGPAVCWERGRHVSLDLARGSNSHSDSVRSFGASNHVRLRLMAPTMLVCEAASCCLLAVWCGNLGVVESFYRHDEACFAPINDRASYTMMRRSGLSGHDPGRRDRSCGVISLTRFSHQRDLVSQIAREPSFVPSSVSYYVLTSTFLSWRRVSPHVATSRNSRPLSIAETKAMRLNPVPGPAQRSKMTQACRSHADRLMVRTLLCISKTYSRPACTNW